MTLLFWIKVIVAVATMAFGVMSIVSPAAAERFTGLTAAGPRGISEIRAVLGGLFVGLGIAALIFRTSSAFGTVGIGYLAIGIVRAASIYFDKAATPSNWASLAAEAVFGILLLISRVGRTHRPPRHCHRVSPPACQRNRKEREAFPDQKRPHRPRLGFEIVFGILLLV